MKNSRSFFLVATIAILAVGFIGCKGDGITTPDPHKLVLSQQAYNITLGNGVILRATGGDSPMSWSSSNNLSLETPPPQSALEGNRAVRVLGLSLGKGWVEAKSADGQTARAEVTVQ